MRRHAFVLLAACSLAALGTGLALSGCAKAPTPVPTVAGPAPVATGRPLQASAQGTLSPKFIGAIDGFGMNLLAATESTGNVIVSPASVHAALSMNVNGATDETEEQMRRVLRTNTMSPDEANRQWALLLAQLAERSPAQKLEIANALWAREGIAFKKPFIDVDRRFFGAGVYTLDFEKDDVAGKINAWADKNTHGMITHMVDVVTPGTILFLTNAVYFKGDWATPFAEPETHTRTFTRADGSKLAVPMMHSTRQMPYVGNATLQATKLPYKGNSSSCYLFLPRPGVSVAAAVASLKGTGLSGLRHSLQSSGTTEVVLGIPKLDLEFATNLASALSDMGMPRAFDEERAQFSGIADGGVGPTFIGAVQHTARVKVDEKGTEAAAVTSAKDMQAFMEDDFEPVSIICDRPYLFAIVDEPSGAVLFLGQVMDPNAK